MRKSKKVLAVMLGACLMTQLCAAETAGAAGEENGRIEGLPEAKEGDVVFLHTNDSHSRVEDYMGFAAVAALREYYEEQGATVFLVDAGDTLHGLPFATVEQGSSIVEVMNLTGYDVMTPGNHDFNYGSDRLLELREQMQFELVSANVFNEADGSYFITPYTVIERDGETYGFFGLSTPETAYKTSPENVEGLSFADPAQAAQDMVDYLSGRGVEHIIAVSHLGTDGASGVTSESVAKQVDGIDLVIDGHSHTAYENGYMVNGTMIVSTGEYIQNIGVVVQNEDGCSASLVNAEQFDGRNEAVTALIAAITVRQDAILSEVVGECAVDLDGERQTNRTQETNFGDLTADAMRAATGADAAITNGGGIRASIPAGEITRKDLVTAFPFGNYVVTKYVSGAELLAALENGVKAYPDTLGGFPQVSGITFSFDPSKEAGSRVSEVKVGGETLVPDKQYLVAMNNFMAAGGDEYTMFADQQIVGEYTTLEEIILQYLQEQGEIPAAGGRINVTQPQQENEDTEDTEETAGGVSADGKDTDKQEVKQLYTVKKGDYLRRLAKHFYGSESLWKRIYEANRDKIKNPDLIWIGMELLIP